MSSQAQPRKTNNLPYRAYMVRLWQESHQTGWRASAQSVQSGEMIRFANLEALFAFLQDRTHNQTDHQS